MESDSIFLQMKNYVQWLKSKKGFFFQKSDLDNFQFPTFLKFKLANFIFLELAIIEIGQKSIKLITLDATILEGQFRFGTL